jgi:hypothetical protein
MTEPLLLRWRGLARAERIGLVAVALVLIGWVLMPVVTQDPAYHRYADGRSWLGIPYAANVLSNAAFVLVGGLGLVRLASPRRAPLAPATAAGAWCMAFGLAATGLGSAWYHLEPTNATLFWDRLPMTLVFAGVIGAAIAQRVGTDAGRRALAALVPLGLASVLWWRWTGDLSLYAVLQLGGALLLLVLVVATRAGADPFPWAWVLAWYVLAKVSEVYDHAIWQATGGLVAGHAVKHLLAAAAGAAALWPLLKRR